MMAALQYIERAGLQTKSIHGTSLGILDGSFVHNTTKLTWFLLHLCIMCCTDTDIQPSLLGNCIHV